MTFEEIKEYSKKGIKVTHTYFMDDEYMTMRENLIIFEDGVKVFAKDWMEGKDYLNDGWSLYVA